MDGETDPPRLRRLLVEVFTDGDEPVDGAVVVILDRHESSPVRCWDNPDAMTPALDELRSGPDGIVACYVCERHVRVIVRDDGRAVLGDWPDVRVSFRETSYLVPTGTDEPETVWVDWPPEE